MNYQIISDGCCDLTQEIIEQYKLRIVPFYISFDQEHYYKEIEEMGIREVYDRMVSQPDVFPKTSLPSVQNYVDIFTEYAKQDIPVLCLCFTIALSGSYNSACNAKEIVEEEFPNAKIHVMNTMSGTVSQALMVMEAGKMQQAGIDYEQCIDLLHKMKESSYIFFSVGSLDYLKHGGRIGKLAGLAASALSLKPLIILDAGEVTSGGVARSRKKSYGKIMDMLKKYLVEHQEDVNDYEYLVGYGYDIEEGERFCQMMEKELKNLGWQEDASLNKLQIGATIAVHTGPHALGIGCIKKYDKYL